MKTPATTRFKGLLIVLLMLIACRSADAQGFGPARVGYPDFLKDGMPVIPRIKIFYADQNTQTFDLPANAQNCIIEVWGGGGVGWLGSGGGGGGYAVTKFSNAARVHIEITVGQGGRQGNTLYFDGRPSKVRFRNNTITANGGGGSGINNAADGGFKIEITDDQTTATGLFGEPGQPNSSEQATVIDDKTIFHMLRGGRGGTAGNTTGVGGYGNNLFVVTKYKANPTGDPGLLEPQAYYQARRGISVESGGPGQLPGGGGGGNAVLKTGYSVGDTTKATSGGNGMVIVYY